MLVFLWLLWWVLFSYSTEFCTFRLAGQALILCSSSESVLGCILLKQTTVTSFQILSHQNGSVMYGSSVSIFYDKGKCLPWRCTGKVVGQLKSSFTLAVQGVQVVSFTLHWLESCGKNPQYPFSCWLDGLQSWSGCFGGTKISRPCRESNPWLSSP
jgi:hypothetical protein